MKYRLFLAIVLDLVCYKEIKVHVFWEATQIWRNLPVDLNFTNIKSQLNWAEYMNFTDLSCLFFYVILKSSKLYGTSI